MKDADPMNSDENPRRGDGRMNLNEETLERLAQVFAVFLEGRVPEGEKEDASSAYRHLRSRVSPGEDL